MYIIQEQGGPVIPPGTGFPFCRLLRLARLRVRYCIPPAHGAPIGSPYITRARPNRLHGVTFTLLTVRIQATAHCAVAIRPRGRPAGNMTVVCASQ
jgi:hypothetical protein